MWLKTQKENGEIKMINSFMINTLEVTKNPRVVGEEWVILVTERSRRKSVLGRYKDQASAQRVYDGLLKTGVFRNVIDIDKMNHDDNDSDKVDEEYALYRTKIEDYAKDHTEEECLDKAGEWFDNYKITEQTMRLLFEFVYTLFPGKLIPFKRSDATV